MLGTRVWHAAIRAIEYLDKHFSQELHLGATLLELGCGLGIPGMIACQLGAQVLLTDQSNILSQLKLNVRHNFPDECRQNENKNDIDNDNNLHRNIITVRELSWSRLSIQNLMRDLKLEYAKQQTFHKFDFVVNCDCVFEPLYGDSWKALIEVIDELLLMNPKSIILTSVERRQFDGIDLFLETLNKSNQVSQTQKVYVDEKNRIELYITKGHGDKL